MKNIAIMQPYFFPYLGYIGLMNVVDEFIILDDVQFIRHGWIERNRIIKQQGGWIYFSVPLKKHNQATLIKDIHIENSIIWKRKLFDQLVVYKKIAPNYYQVKKWLENTLSDEFNSISELNVHVLQELKVLFGLRCNICRFNDSSKIRGRVNAPDEWALEICKLYEGKVTYINPEGGRSFFNEGKYRDSGIKLNFYSQKLHIYNQRVNFPFEPGLSVLDLMMFNSNEEIRIMMRDFELL
jgi:hypothetical protein